MHDRDTLAFLAFLQIVICFIGKLWSRFQSHWFVLCTCFTWLGCVGTRIQWLWSVGLLFFVLTTLLQLVCCALSLIVFLLFFGLLFAMFKVKVT